MGACVGKKKNLKDEEYARQLQEQELQNGGYYANPNYNPQAQRPPVQRSSQTRKPQGAGQILGGGEVPMSAEERKQRQLQAAEARAQSNQQRGGVSAAKAKNLEESHVKEELIGRIQAYCKMRRIDEPMGLRLASVEQLRETLARLQT